MPVESTRFLNEIQNIEDKFKKLNLEANNFDTGNLVHPHPLDH
jgi:hypothetical protein